MHDLTELGLFAAAILAAPFAMKALEAAERWRERMSEPDDCTCVLDDDEPATCRRCGSYLEIGGSE